MLRAVCKLCELFRMYGGVRTFEGDNHDLGSSFSAPLLHLRYSVDQDTRIDDYDVCVFLLSGPLPLAPLVRILEAQVGTNPRIRVQRDDAFVPWDSIPFHDGVPPAPSPEWVRRTICCARWEVEHATAETGKPDTQPKVILAVLSGTPEPLSDGAPASGATSTSPVPLPAPQPNKHEPRATGTMILQWAARAGLDVFEVAPTQLQNGKDGHPAGPRRSGEQGRRSPDDNRNPRGRRNSNQQRYDGRGAGNGGGGLVERPPAVMAMMEAVSQPSRVVRVLARGEKLDPN